MRVRPCRQLVAVCTAIDDFAVANGCDGLPGRVDYLTVDAELPSRLAPKDANNRLVAKLKRDDAVKMHLISPALSPKPPETFPKCPDNWRQISGNFSKCPATWQHMSGNLAEGLGKLPERSRHVAAHVGKLPERSRQLAAHVGKLRGSCRQLAALVGKLSGHHRPFGGRRAENAGAVRHVAARVRKLPGAVRHVAARVRKVRAQSEKWRRASGNCRERPATWRRASGKRACEPPGGDARPETFGRHSPGRRRASAGNRAGRPVATRVAWAPAQGARMCMSMGSSAWRMPRPCEWFPDDSGRSSGRDSPRLCYQRRSQEVLNGRRQPIIQRPRTRIRRDAL